MLGSEHSLTALLDGEPAEIAAYADGVTTTRGELAHLAATLSEMLRDLELEGCVIGVCLPNVPETIAAWFAVWQAGAAFVPLNPRAPEAEIERTVETTGVLAIISEGAPYAVRICRPPVPRFIEPGEAIVQFTSGTTGPPKAVPLRHDTVSELLDSVIGSLRGSAPAGKARMPNLVPVSLALWAGIYQVLFAFKLGVPVVLMEKFVPQEFARLVHEHEIRSSVLPPAALVMLLDDPEVETLAPLRYVRSVSAPLSAVHARRFHERFGVAILNGYGQTELGGEVIGWTAADWKTWGADKLGAVGRPHAGIEVRVHDDELEVRRAGNEDWSRTGDLGRIDDDGFVWIDGRVSDMINRGGLKVFPDDVEEQLRAHDAIDDVAVVGVPDERLGEVPWAFIVVHAGAAIDADALRDWCRDRVAPYKIPAGVTVVDTLPRNEIGKLLRRELGR